MVAENVVKDRQTERQTDRPNTVALAALARRGLRIQRAISFQSGHVVALSFTLCLIVYNMDPYLTQYLFGLYTNKLSLTFYWLVKYCLVV